jgi:predicted ATP-dependent endonuclease of OLD family
VTRILGFKIEGLTGRKEPVAFTLEDDTNIFFGLNGSGKTSLLRILVGALLDDVTHLRRVPFESAEVTFSDAAGPVVTRSITAGTVNALAPLPPITMITPSGPINIPQAGPQNAWESTARLREPFAVSYLPTWRLFSDLTFQGWVGGPDGSPYSETRLDQQFFQLLHNRWSQYLNADLTRVRALQDDGIASILDSLFTMSESSVSDDSAADDLGAFERVKDFLQRRDLKVPIKQEAFRARYSESPLLRRVVGDIAETERRIHDVEQPRLELTQLLNRLFSHKEIELAQNIIRVILDGGTEITLELLSSGEKHLLRILIEALSAGGNCLLIDEPELSLHVDWQRDLVAAMRTVNPELQIIMATHSPEIMADVSDAKIFAL